MKTKLAIFCITIFFIGFQSCNNKETQNDNSTKIITSKVISLQYDNTKIGSIKNNDSFIFDNHKIIHRDDFLKNNSPFSLPSSNPTLIKTDTKILEEKMNIISMAMIFANKLGALKEYNFINLRQTSINGKIIIERKDGKEITVEISNSYPLFIDKYTK